MILDDGDEKVSDLIPNDHQIRYLSQQAKDTIGAKRNMACAEAKGEIILHWDDDDWYASHRVSYQVDALLREGTGVCGINRLLYFRPETGTAWEYVWPAEQKIWLSGSTLCYTREFWTGNRFPEINVGEDAYFVWNAQADQISVLPDSTFHVGIIHQHNTSPKQTNGAYWQKFPVDEIRRLLKVDWTAYQAAAHRSGHKDIGPTTKEGTTHLVTLARQSDLSLPEFIAYNQGQSLPWMRRWELPFALFGSRLPNTGSILDCTINPVKFEEFLGKLYPHILYRHWNRVAARI